MSTEVEVYVFLMRRPKVDSQAWPVVYQDRELAEKALGRVSPVAAVRFGEGLACATMNFKTPPAPIAGTVEAIIVDGHRWDIVDGAYEMHIPSTHEYVWAEVYETEGEKHPATNPNKNCFTECVLRETYDSLRGRYHRAQAKLEQVHRALADDEVGRDTYIRRVGRALNILNRE